MSPSETVRGTACSILLPTLKSSKKLPVILLDSVNSNVLLWCGRPLPTPCQVGNLTPGWNMSQDGRAGAGELAVAGAFAVEADAAAVRDGSVLLEDDLA